ncbi:ribbon-helix-helix domain-containing protein [Caballeronia sp. Sq4a]|uniref:ribbon-helix-helix domain-containing protein n=1 Tax=Caballeronia sp. Sq4a TaxID=2878152 RepID=UPI0020BE3F54|nr:ribbon-helix-helix domain-containing protein [Caballeronia sp. Sq4a]
MTKAHTSVRLEPAHQEQLREIAERRSTNVTALINEAVAQFVREEGLRDEVREIERRLNATAIQTQKETARVGDDVQLLIAQVDQLMRFVFQATPEIFDKDAAAIVGSRRYAGFLESFHKQFTGRKRRALFAADVDDEENGTKDLRED